MELDYDLRACLQHNPQDGITEETITTVLAVWEGENEGDDWRWVVDLADGRFAFIQGGCDYTGWDCQSDADSEFAVTPQEAAGHALTVNRYKSNGQEVYESLMAQLADGKNETWRESKDREFSVVSGQSL